VNTNPKNIGAPSKHREWQMLQPSENKGTRRMALLAFVVSNYPLVNFGEFRKHLKYIP
jgi:hypothetical protein